MEDDIAIRHYAINGLMHSPEDRADWLQWRVMVCDRQGWRLLRK